MSEPLVLGGPASGAIDGWGILASDWQNMGAVAGLADDRVLAELLRLAPYDGTNVYRGIIPYGYGGALAATSPGGTVQSSGTGNGSITVFPFRAVIGSRNAANAGLLPNDPAQRYQPTSLANWRDIRSGIFMGTSSTLSAPIQLADNGGNPRWDLIYAMINVDANGPAVSRRVKSPSAGNISLVSIPAWVSSPVTVSVVTGIAGSSPALPAIPSDGSGIYYVPLAYVFVPASFSSTSTVATKNIRAFANATSTFFQPGHGAVEPASGSNDRSSTYATNFPWASSGRPGPFLPPDMVGGVTKIVEVDAYSGGANWSHANGAVVDASIDWRNRFVRTDYQSYNGSSVGGMNLGSNPSSGVSGRLQMPISFPSTGSGYVAGTALSGTFGQGNDTLVTDCPTVLNFVPGSGMVAGLYVDSATGRLLFYGTTGGTTIGYLFFWITASAALPNY